MRSGSASAGKATVIISERWREDMTELMDLEVSDGPPEEVPGDVDDLDMRKEPEDRA